MLLPAGKSFAGGMPAASVAALRATLLANGEFCPVRCLVGVAYFMFGDGCISTSGNIVAAGFGRTTVGILLTGSSAPTLEV